MDTTVLYVCRLCGGVRVSGRMGGCADERQKERKQRRQLVKDQEREMFGTTSLYKTGVDGYGADANLK